MADAIPERRHIGLVIRMDQRRPVDPTRIAVPHAKELTVRAIDELHHADGIRHPDRQRRVVGHGPETGFAFAERLFRERPISD
ncbi:MAG TPA: hypothetical protein VFT47_01330, partial [Vicinamibacterales bacterium]|nr:hypothetical protein [Vicinamibacterales bacterium]